MRRDVVIVSNRGPLSYAITEDDELVTRRGAGGLVSSLGPLVEGTTTTWIAAAISEGDRRAAQRGLVEADGFRLRSLALDLDDYRMAYDVVSNATLWFIHHDLFDLPRRPLIDRRWREAWAGYRRVNEAFAHAVCEEAPEGATVLVQDYHLTLLAPVLRRERPDLQPVHFHHTPFCDPNSIRVLPHFAAEELLEGLSAHVACGFHSARWADAFEACCREVLGTAPRTFIAPLAPDPDDLAKTSASEACALELRSIDELVGERKMILRVDRIELSKNLLRGFHAFDDLLRTYPEWRERVVFLALAYPSRDSLADYLAYRQEVENVVERINQRWATPGWTPIELDLHDNFPRSVAALRRYDVLLVNPIKDGLNLVAKEGALVNERDGVLALSPEAGAWEELNAVALEVNPYDVAATADVLNHALAMGSADRADHARRLKDAVAVRTPADWLEDQLRVVESPS